VARDDKESKHEMLYLGSHERPLEQVDIAPAAPSVALARNVSLSILGGDRGSIKSLPHFLRRMRERNFNLFDVEYAIRNGECVKAEYCPDFKNHKYKFNCLIDGVGFDAVFALSSCHDLVKAPLMYLITGCWKTESSLRTTRY